MEVEFHGIAIQINPPHFQGVSVRQNPGSFQGASVDQSRAVFQGVSMRQNPIVYQGLAVEEGERILQPAVPACPGEVVESYLAIIRGKDGSFLKVLDQTFTPVFHISLEGVAPVTRIEALLGNGATSGAMRVMGPECKEAFCLEGQEASIIVGCEYRDGTILVRNARGEAMISIEGRTGRVDVGGIATHGELRVLPPPGTMAEPPLASSLFFNAGVGNLELNGNGVEGGRLWLRKAGVSSIYINGDRGEIEMANADFAEEYPIAATEAVSGMVMVLNAEGNLHPCTEAYDSRVAGILSGAGTFQPAIVLDKQEGTGTRRHPVAMIGKVYGWADATQAAISPGDLLTTSPTPGHAMKASDPERAFGATLGKAMQALPRGSKGLIPIRVSLI